MPRPLKIVHLIHSGAIGGGPQVVLDLATSVAAFHTIVVPDDGPLLSDAARQGIETVRLEFAGKVSFGLSLPRLVWMFRRADVVHLHGQFAGFYGSLAARLAGIPTLYTAHFPSFVTDWNWHNRIRNHVAESVTCSNSSLVVACSEAMREEYLRRGLVAAAKIRTIYNGVRHRAPERPVSAVRSELGLDADAPIVLGVGRFSWQKGFDLLVEAVPAILDVIPEARFVLAGDGEMRGSLEARARQLGVEDNVLFLGFRRDTCNLYQVAAAVAVPSRYEVFPLVPLEAMMAGRPLVASDLSVLREAVKDGRDGILVPPTERGLIDGLRSLLLNRENSEIIASQGAQRAERDFGVEKMAGEYARIYDLLGSRQS